MTVTWSKEAREALRNIGRYLEQTSGARSAAATVRRLNTRTRQLGVFPHSGRMLPEVVDAPQLRELIVPPYRVLYMVEREKIVIVTVAHSAQDLSALQ